MRRQEMLDVPERMSSVAHIVHSVSGHLSIVDFAKSTKMVDATNLVPGCRCFRTQGTRAKCTSDGVSRGRSFCESFETDLVSNS